MNRPPPAPLCYPIDYQLTIGRTFFLRVAVDPATKLCETCEASLAHT